MDKNSAETAAKTQISFWAGARGPACKMGWWDVPPKFLGLPAAGGHPTKKHSGVPTYNFGKKVGRPT